MSNTPLTRDGVRASFAAYGMTFADLPKGALRALEQSIDREMQAAALMDGTFRMRDLAGSTEYLRCKSFYFDDREAVSFNKDGFIGFAGWADEHNVQPILRGFMEWLAACINSEVDDFVENATYEELLAAQDFNGEQAERDAWDDYYAAGGE